MLKTLNIAVNRDCVWYEIYGIIQPYPLPRRADIAREDRLPEIWAVNKH